MNIASLLASSAVAALLCTSPAMAQIGKQDQGPAAAPQLPAPSAPAPQRNEAPGNTPGAGAQPQKAPPKQAQPKPEAPGPRQAQPKQDTPKQAQPKDKQDRQRPAQVQRPSETKQPGTANTPDGNEPRKNAEPGKAAPQPGTAPAPKNAQTESRDNKGPDRAADRTKGPGVQLSEQKRADVHRDILKERNVNRANVRVDVRVGTRVPRSVRLAPLPASVIALAPAYRSYRYFVVDDRICIVQPTTYEVVDVILPDRQVAQHGGQKSAGLTLSQQEREIILREVDLQGDSTLGLGAIEEGSQVPRAARLQPLPVTVTDRIPRLNGFTYLVVEDRVALVDRPGIVQAIIEIHRQR